MKKVLDKKSFIEDVNNIASTQYKLVSDNSNTKKDIASTKNKTFAEPYQVAALLRRTAKMSSPSYRAAITRRKKDPLQYRMRKILGDLRKHMHPNDYFDLLHSLAQADTAEQDMFVRSIVALMQKHIEQKEIV